MKQRVITALLLAPLAISALLLASTPWVAALLALALLIGLWEWLRLIGLPSRPTRALIVGLNAVAIVLLAQTYWPESGWAVVYAAGAGWLLVCFWLTRPARGSSRQAMPIKLAAGSLMVLSTWSAICLLHAAGSYGPRWTLFALMIVWAADTFAYFVGSRFGGPKLAPKISPGKTWSGFFGGLFGALFICPIALPLLGLQWNQLLPLLLLALVVALASVVGDLFESLVKRHAGAKDSGKLIPGHGGVLDRIDSVMAALPIFAIGKLWLGLQVV